MATAQNPERAAMADLSTGIQRHYGGAAIVQRVLTAVAATAMM
jgi:hypothetical protein